MSKQIRIKFKDKANSHYRKKFDSLKSELDLKTDTSLIRHLADNFSETKNNLEAISLDLKICKQQLELLK